MHVVKKNRGELVLVFGLEQIGQNVGRQFCECVIGRGEHRERSGTFKGIHQSGCRDGFDEGRHGCHSGAGRDLNDVAGCGGGSSHGD